MGIFWKRLHHPTCLHTPENSVPYKLKRLVNCKKGSGQRFAEARLDLFDGTTRELADRF